MEECIFCKIASKAIPAKVIMETEQSLAFHDIQPQAPVHVLVIPKKHIPRLDDAQEEDEALLGHLLNIARKLARRLGISEGYRLVLNNGPQAGQSVFHIHLHLLGGRAFRWPPG